MKFFWQSEWKVVEMPFRLVPLRPEDREEDFLDVGIEAIGNPDGVRKYFYVDCMYGNSETSDSEYHAFREKLNAASETSRVKVHLRYRGGKLRNFDIRPEDLAAATGCDLCLKLEVLGGGIDDRSECDRVKHVERSR